MAFTSNTNVLSEQMAVSTTDVIETVMSITDFIATENLTLSGGTEDQIHKVKPSFSAVDTVRSSTRSGLDADYGAADPVTAVAVTIDMNEKSQVVVDVPAADVRQSRWAVLDAIAVDAGLKHLADIGSWYFDLLVKLVTHAITGAPDTSANGNAGSIGLWSPLGDAAGAHIDTDGTVQGDEFAMGKLVRERVRAASVYAKRAKQTGNVQAVVGSEPGQLMALAAPEVWRPFLDLVESEGNALEPIAVPVFRDGTLTEGQPEGVLGRYRGVTLAESVDLPRPATDASGWDLFIGSARCSDYGKLMVASQLLTPESNQSAPRYSYRSTMAFGGALINSALLTRTRINSGAALG